MAKGFKDLKRQSKNGDALKALQASSSYDLGMHRKKKLRMARCGNSGTLLHSKIAEAHGAMLSEEYRAYWSEQNGGAVGRDKNGQRRLRFLSILDSVVDLDVDGILDAAKAMERRLNKAFKVTGIWFKGAVEVEIVNLDLLRQIEKTRKDEKRKLTVLSDLYGAQDARGSKALVHCHLLVDLGVGSDAEIEDRAKAMRVRMDNEKAWRRAKWQTMVLKTYKQQIISKKMAAIASYLTKCGNEDLRYKAGFGRELLEDLEAKMHKAGMLNDGQGAETVTDERGLRVVEVALLDQVYRRLMDRRKDGRGYLITINAKAVR